MTYGEMNRDGTTYRSTCDRYLAADARGIEQSSKIVRHIVEGDLAANFLGQAGTARVVAQDAPGVVQGGYHLVPTVQRAAHFVHQHQRRLAGTGQFATQAG